MLIAAVPVFVTQFYLMPLSLNSIEVANEDLCCGFVGLRGFKDNFA